MRFASFIALTALVGCAASAPQPSASDGAYHLVSFPAVNLAEGERIAGVEVIVTCGRFCAINYIPDDWSVAVEAPVAEVTTLKAACGHGAGAFWTTANLAEFITVCAYDPECFDINATLISTTDFEHEVTRAFTRGELLMTVPNKSLQPTRAAQPFGKREPARCGPRG